MKVFYSFPNVNVFVHQYNTIISCFHIYLACLKLFENSINGTYYYNTEK
jgi:hypothetical protein